MSGRRLVAGPVSSRNRASGRSHAIEHALFGVVPLAVCVYLVAHVLGAGIGGIDFRTDFWVAGSRLLHGGDPYTWTARQIHASIGFPYPALTAWMFAAFALLPIGISTVLYTLLCVAAGLAALWLIGVRDWRVVGAVLISPWFVSAWQTANITMLLLLGVAAVWRVRDRPLATGILTALVVTLKPIMWPLGLWLLATRRYRACGWGVAAGLLVNAVTWAVVGVSRFPQYLHLGNAVTAALYRTGYGLPSVVAHLGGGWSAGLLVEILVSGLVLVACLRTGRRAADRDSLIACVLLSLVASPLVWTHYFALLLIAIALRHPRLHWTWLAGLLLWGCGVRTTVGWQIALTWVVVLAISADLLWPGARLRLASAPRTAQNAAPTA